MVFALLLALERTGVLLWCLCSFIACLNLLSPSNFSNSDTDFALSVQHLHLKNILHTSPREYCSLFHLLVLFSLSLCLYLLLSLERWLFWLLQFPANSFSLLLSLSQEPVLPRVLFTFWLLVGFSQWKDKRWKEKKNLWGYLFLLLSLCFDEFVAVAVSYSWCPLSLLGATLFPSLFHQSWLLILIPGYLSIPC